MATGREQRAPSTFDWRLEDGTRLEDGHLGGAALDVWWRYPPKPSRTGGHHAARSTNCQRVDDAALFEQLRRDGRAPLEHGGRQSRPLRAQGAARKRRASDLTARPTRGFGGVWWGTAADLRRGLVLAEALVDDQAQQIAKRGHQFVTRYPKASDISSPPCLLRLLPAGAVAGWGSHPLETPDGTVIRRSRGEISPDHASGPPPKRAASDAK
jgi:hypothetical protein